MKGQHTHAAVHLLKCAFETLLLLHAPGFGCILVPMVYLTGKQFGPYQVIMPPDVGCRAMLVHTGKVIDRANGSMVDVEESLRGQGELR